MLHARRAGAIASAIGGLLSAPTVPAIAAPAPAYAQLHVFSGGGAPEGFGPYGELAVGTDGNYYGLTFFGGEEEKRCDCSVGGVLFQMTPKGVVKALHTFFAPDSGIGATGGLTLGRDGFFYGLTSGGGAYGGGTAYKVDTAGHFTLLHSFGRGPDGDGMHPYLGRLVEGADGRFYGMTSVGGKARFGTLFAMSPAGVVTVLHAFGGSPADGATPRGGLTLASNGKMYGTTLCGGAEEPAGECGGTIFSWSAGSGFAIVHSFDGNVANKSGHAPQAAPTEANGFLYGTTALGGAAAAGTVYRMALASGAVTMVHAFLGGVGAANPNPDGKGPAGRMVLGDDGRLYGTTSNGGPNRQVHPEGDGTIYSVGLDDSYAQVYAFGASSADGSHPMSGFVKNANGVLLGVTESGGPKFTGTSYAFNPSAQ